MLSPRIITILALIVAATAYPAIRKPIFKRPVTSLNRTELEDASPWIKFPLFGNILESFPNFLPTIPEAGPKIENDNQKFQVIINVEGYNKDFLKVRLGKGNFIIIQGAHEDIQDSNSSIDSQFIHTYTLPLKAIASSVTAILTSDGYLVVTVPIGNIINKITYNEKEIPIIESGEPLLEPTVEINVSTTSSPVSLIQATPSIVLLPPNPTNDEILSIESLIPTIPSPVLLPPKPTNDEAGNDPIVIPVPLDQVNNNPTVISIPLTPQNVGQEIIVAPTYAPVTTIQASYQNSESESEYNKDVQLEENVPTPSNDINVNSNNVSVDQKEDDNQTTETLLVFREPMQGLVIVSHTPQEPEATEQTLVNEDDGNYASTTLPLQEQTTSINEITEKTVTIQPEKESVTDYTTEISSLQQFETTDKIANVLRSDISQEQDGVTGDPEIGGNVEQFNEEEETNTNVPDIISTHTTNSQILLQEEDENELIVASYTSPPVFSEEEDKYEEKNNIPIGIVRTVQDKYSAIGSDNTFEDSTLAENLPSLEIVEQPESSTTGESLSNIAIVSYNEALITSAPKIEESTEQIILSGSETNKTSEVNES